MAKAKRAALYLRVSTNEQTTDNQRRELEQAAAHRGWDIVAVYEDPGISGAKGRDKRPGFDAALKDAVKRKYDILMVWAVDRLGRSLVDLVNGLQELQGANADLFILQQALDTTTPAGKALFGMLGVFSEFERSIITSRINAGIARIKAGAPTKSGKPTGRPPIAADLKARIREELARGTGIIKVSKTVGGSVGGVASIAQEMVAEGLLPSGDDRLKAAYAARVAQGKGAIAEAADTKARSGGKAR